MNPEERNITTAVVAVEEQLPVPATKKSVYWGKVASSYTVIWRVLLIALILFAALFMLLFSRAFTYDSVFCFFKDLQAVSAFVPSDYDVVHTTYEEGEHVSLPYRGGIAFVNNGGIEVYSPDGKRLLDVDRTLKNPRAVASRKYLVAFENGGTGFSVTNSYAELFHGETEFPIYGAEISDSGHFALITTSDEVLSQVLLYDNNFNLIQRFRRASATVGVGLSDNGKRIALLGAGAENGTVQTQLDVFLLGETEAELSLVLQEEFPLSVGFTGNKNMMVFTDKALRCCNADGKMHTELMLEGAPAAFVTNGNGALLALETDALTATHRVIALDKKGNTVYDGIFTGDITAAALGENELFLLSGERAVRVDVKNAEMTEITVTAGATDLYIVDECAVRVVYPAKTEYYIFTD